MGKNPWQDIWQKGKLGKGNTKGSMVDPGGSQKPREYISALQLLLKPTITYGKGRARRFPCNNQLLGRSMSSSWPVKGVPKPKHG
jgi:hypothetical protein